MLRTVLMLCSVLAACSAGADFPLQEQDQRPAVPSAWGPLSGNAETGLLKAQQYCSGCHQVNGKGKRFPAAPAFTDTVQREDITVDYLTHWIDNPQALKPGTLMPQLGLKTQDQQDIIAWLYHLKQTGQGKHIER